MGDIYKDNCPKVTEKGAAYTIVADDNGKVFLQTGVSGTWTLPAIADVWNGWNVEIYNLGATSLVVTAPSGKLIGFHNAAGTTITFSTAGNIIGAGVKIMYAATTGKYMAFAYGANTAVMS